MATRNSCQECIDLLVERERSLSSGEAKKKVAIP
jgi:hypothetical protein